MGLLLWNKVQDSYKESRKLQPSRRPWDMSTKLSNIIFSYNLTIKNHSKKKFNFELKSQPKLFGKEPIGPLAKMKTLTMTISSYNWSESNTFPKWPPEKSQTFFAAFSPRLAINNRWNFKYWVQIICLPLLDDRQSKSKSPRLLMLLVVFSPLRNIGKYPFPVHFDHTNRSSQLANDDSERKANHNYKLNSHF